MGRIKLLFKNVGLFTVSSFSIKLVAFILLPLHTRVLDLSDYGKYDVFLLLISFFMPIFTLAIYEAVLRFTIAKSSPSEVLKIAHRILLKGFLLLIILFYPISLYFDINSFYGVFLIIFFLQALQRIYLEHIKGLGNIKLVATIGFVQSLVLLFLNYLFIIKIELQLEGVLYAILISNIISIAIYIYNIDNNIFLSKNPINSDLEKEMLKFSLPIIPNNIAWWFNNFSSRILIQQSLSYAEMGLFAAASKIPALATFFQGIFIQAWQYSVIKEYDSDDKNEYYKEVYQSYTVFLILFSSTLILCIDKIADILLGTDFLEAVYYIPFLISSVVFSALSGFIGQIFIASKETKILFKSSLIGAIVNVVLNVIFVPIYGLFAASIISAVSAIVLWRYRLSFCDKSFYKSIKYSNIILHIIFIIFVIYSTFFKEITVLLFLYSLILFFSKNLFFKIIQLWKYIIK